MLSAVPNNKYWGRCVFNFQNFRIWPQKEKKAKMLMVTPKRHPSAAPPCPRRPPALRRWTPTTLSWTSWLLWCSPLPLIGSQGKCIHGSVGFCCQRFCSIFCSIFYSGSLRQLRRSTNFWSRWTSWPWQNTVTWTKSLKTYRGWIAINILVSITSLYGVYVSEVSRIWTPNTLNFCPI